MGRLSYEELSKRRFKEQRNVVISKAKDKRTGEGLGFSISEQLVTTECGKETRMFLKNGLGVVDRVGLIQLRDCINEAIDKTSEKGIDTEQ